MKSTRNVNLTDENIFNGKSQTNSSKASLKS